jgi:hypothetical protein
MTKKLLLILVVCATLLLAACSRIQATTTVAQKALAGETNSSTAVSGQGLSALQLAIGTLSLDSSAVPIDAQQAAALLPLWKGARSLAQSDTAADQEITALVAQIQAGLTAEQLQYIQSMTAQELSSLAQEYGQAAGPSAAPAADSASATSGVPGAMGPTGGMDGAGGPPPDGGMPGGAPSAASGGVSGTSSVSTASFQGVNATMLEAVIQDLQTRAH